MKERTAKFLYITEDQRPPFGQYSARFEVDQEQERMRVINFFRKYGKVIHIHGLDVDGLDGEINSSVALITELPSQGGIQRHIAPLSQTHDALYQLLYVRSIYPSLPIIVYSSFSPPFPHHALRENRMRVVLKTNLRRDLERMINLIVYDLKMRKNYS